MEKRRIYCIYEWFANLIYVIIHSFTFRIGEKRHSLSIYYSTYCVNQFPATVDNNFGKKPKIVKSVFAAALELAFALSKCVDQNGCVPWSVTHGLRTDDYYYLVSMKTI